MPVLFRAFVAAALFLACASAIGLPISANTPDFAIKVNSSRISMGKVVSVSITWPSPPTPSGTVFWPFVNGSQWGAFVTCFVQPPSHAAASDESCSIELPLPFSGENTLQFAVFEEGNTPARSFKFHLTPLLGRSSVGRSCQHF
jgi:hypothetical protein